MIIPGGTTWDVAMSQEVNENEEKNADSRSNYA